VWGFIGLLAGFMITWPWTTLTIGMAIYISSIPFGIAMQARRERAARGSSLTLRFQRDTGDVAV